MYGYTRPGHEPSPPCRAGHSRCDRRGCDPPRAPAFRVRLADRRAEGSGPADHRRARAPRGAVGHPGRGLRRRRSTRRTASMPRSWPPSRRSPSRRRPSRPSAASSPRSPCRRTWAPAPTASDRCSRIPPRSPTTCSATSSHGVALSAGTATTDELDQAVSDLHDEQAILEDTRDQAVAKAEQVEQAKQATEEKKAEYTEARSSAEAELGRLVQEEEERRARESYERIQAAARQAAADQAAAAAAAAQAQQRASTAAAAVAPSSGGNSSTRSGGNSTSSGGNSATHRWGRTERRRRRQPCTGRGGPDPGRVVPGRDGGQRCDEPARHAVSLRRLPAGRRLRLLRAHVVGVGSGRRVAARTSRGPSSAASPTSPSRRPSRATCCSSTRRSATSASTSAAVSTCTPRTAAPSSRCPR